MGSGFKDRSSVARNRQKPSKICFMTTLSRIIKSAEEPPTWTRFRQIVRLVTDGAALLIVVFLLHASNWVVLVHPNGPGGNALGTINTSVSYGAWITLMSFCIAVLYNVWKLI